MNIEYSMPKKDVKEYESYDLYDDMLCHLQYMYTDKKMFYLSPHGGVTPIVIDEVFLTTESKDVDDLFFKQMCFKVYSKNGNCYSMNDLYFGRPDVDSVENLYAACEYSNK